MKQNRIPGFFSWFGYDVPLDERFKHIKEAFFPRVSIWLGNEEELAKNDRIKEMPILASESGLTIECAHAPYQGCNGIWNGTDTVKRQLLIQYGTHIRFCKQNQIPIMVMHISQGNEPPNPNEDGISLVKELVAVASEFKVIIAIENTRKTDALNFLLSKIDSSFLGLCYDSSHDFLYSKQPTRILSDWGARLKYTHFSDNDGISDRHWLPGTGIINWDLIRSAFPKESEDCISLEVVPKNNATEPIRAFLATAYQTGLWLDEMLRS